MLSHDRTLSAGALQEDMRLGRSKIFARAAAVPGMLVPHHLEGRQPTRVVSWPDIGRCHPNVRTLDLLQAALSCSLVHGSM